MNIESIATFLNNLSLLKIDQKVCSKYITPRSTCNKCLEICPEKSISIGEDNIEIKSNCNNCGLCVAACPNHVFKLDEDLLATYQASEEPIIITCTSFAKKIKGLDENKLVKINCMGQLYPELVINLIAKAKQIVIFLDPKDCENCLKYDISSLQESLKAFEKPNHAYLSSSLELRTNLKELQPLLPAKNINEVESTDRRQFFKSIFSGIKGLPQKLVNSTLEGLDMEDEQKEEIEGTENISIPKTEASKKKYLIEALEMPKIKDRLYSLPYKSLEISNCNFCEGCTRLCPTGALHLIHDEDIKEIKFVASLCTECNICQDVCYFQSISWSNKVSIADFVNRKPMTVATSKKKICPVCQQEYWLTSNNDQCCSWCKK